MLKVRRRKNLLSNNTGCCGRVEPTRLYYLLLKLGKTLE